MDEDVPMDQDEVSKPEGVPKENGDDLEQYHLDDYDEDEGMPGKSVALAPCPWLISSL